MLYLSRELACLEHGTFTAGVQSGGEVCALTQARRPRDSSSLLCALLFLTECFRSTIYVRFSAHPQTTHTSSVGYVLETGF